jgi:hypothetical protein
LTSPTRSKVTNIATASAANAVQLVSCASGPLKKSSE